MSPPPNALEPTMHVITGLAVGGAETMLKRLALLRPEQSRVISLTGLDAIGPEIRAGGAPVEALEIDSLRGLGAGLLHLRRDIQRSHPGAVMGWMYHGMLAVTLATLGHPASATVWNVRVAIHDLSIEKPRTRQLIKSLAWLSRFPSRIIYNSRVSAEQHARIGYDDRRNVIIPNGFDTQLLRPDLEERIRIRKELGYERDELVIGMVARYHTQKNHPGLMRVARKVIDIEPRARFVCAGRGVTREEPALDAMIREYGLHGHMQLLGQRRDIPALLNAFDVSVLPSISEGFPNAVGEAMACAVPCVVTDVGDAAYVLGDAGAVVACGDDDALAHELLQLLRVSEAERRQLGETGRERIERNFSIAAIADRYDALYQELNA